MVQRRQLELPGVEREAGEDGRRGGGALRGEIRGYSAASKRRLRETVWAVQPALLPRRRGRSWVRPASFVTLTYPARWPSDPRQWKRDLDVWIERVRRRWPSAWAIWALELQARGAPHYHLIIRWPPERTREAWRDRQAWISRTWAEVVAGPGAEVEPEHLAAGTNLKPLVTDRALAEYVAKPGQRRPVSPGGGEPRGDLEPSHGAALELSKGRQREGSGQGRWWGIANRAGYRECARVVEVDLPPLTAARIAVAIEASWRIYAERTGGEWDHWPRWASGPHVRAALAAGVRDDLFKAPWIDVTTGELLDIGALTVEDFGGARSA